MAWSSFAHLPTNENEYWNILSNLKNGMTAKEVDNVIAACKGKETVENHYRGNLARINLIQINKGSISLNYDEKQLSQNKDLLKDILNEAFKKNQSNEVTAVADIITKIHSYDLNQIIDILKISQPLKNRSSLVRWVRPIVNFLKIIDILTTISDETNHYLKLLQTSYLNIANDFNQPIPLESVEIELKKINVTYSIITILNNILEEPDNRFKIELLMMPRWATKKKNYKINQDLYTHIKIKTDLLKEDIDEKSYLTR